MTDQSDERTAYVIGDVLKADLRLTEASEDD
jgi:hypothetical protein